MAMSEACVKFCFTVSWTSFVCRVAKLLSPNHLRDMFKVLLSTERSFLYAVALIVC